MFKLLLTILIFLIYGCAANTIYVDTDKVDGLGVEVSFPEGKIIPISVKKVISGNIIELTNRETVSYIGVHIPNLYDIPARARALNEEMVMGNDIRLGFDRRQRGSGQRLLAYVYTEDGVFVNAEIIREGLAKALIKPPNTLYSDVLLQAEEEAHKAERGIWSRDFKD